MSSSEGAMVELTNSPCPLLPFLSLAGLLLESVQRMELCSLSRSSFTRNCSCQGQTGGSRPSTLTSDLWVHLSFPSSARTCCLPRWRHRDLEASISLQITTASSLLESHRDVQGRDRKMSSKLTIPSTSRFPPHPLLPLPGHSRTLRRRQARRFPSTRGGSELPRRLLCPYHAQGPFSSSSLPASALELIISPLSPPLLLPPIFRFAGPHLSCLSLPPSLHPLLLRPSVRRVVHLRSHRQVRTSALHDRAFGTELRTSRDGGGEGEDVGQDRGEFMKRRVLVSTRRRTRSNSSLTPSSPPLPPRSWKSWTSTPWRQETPLSLLLECKQAISHRRAAYTRH